MVIQEGPGGIGTKVIANRYPVDEGLIAGTTKQSSKASISPNKSFVTFKRHGI
jgi:hypothetical protein